MPKLVIIPEDRLRSLVEDAVRRAVEGVMSEATFVNVDLPTPQAPPEPPTAGARRHRTSPMASKEEDGTAEAAARNGRRYVIGRAEGEHSYADVVAIELDKPTFRFEEAWRAIKGKIVTSSERARGSTRRALDMDDRFERIPDRDGIWYRRTDMEQLSME